MNYFVYNACSVGPVQPESELAARQEDESGGGHGKQAGWIRQLAASGRPTLCFPFHAPVTCLTLAVLLQTRVVPKLALLNSGDLYRSLFKSVF